MNSLYFPGVTIASVAFKIWKVDYSSLGPITHAMLDASKGGPIKGQIQIKANPSVYGLARSCRNRHRNMHASHTHYAWISS